MKWGAMMLDILKQNKKSWDKVARHFNGKDALPSYGPFTQTEEELRYRMWQWPLLALYEGNGCR